MSKLSVPPASAGYESAAQLAADLDALVRALSRAIRRASQPALEEAGLTPSRLWVLIHVRRQPGLTMGELAERMDLSKGTVTPLVDELARRGALRREHDPSDRRVIRLYIESEGARALDRVLAKRRQAVQQALESLSPDQARVVVAGLRRVAEHLGAEVFPVEADV